MGPYGATCFTQLSNTLRDIDKTEWDIERTGMICGKSESFTDLKKAVIKLCSISKRCSFDVKKKAITFGNNIETFNLRLSSEGIYEQE